MEQDVLNWFERKKFVKTLQVFPIDKCIYNVGGQGNGSPP